MKKVNYTKTTGGACEEFHEGCKDTQFGSLFVFLLRITRGELQGILGIHEGCAFGSDTCGNL